MKKLLLILIVLNIVSCQTKNEMSLEYQTLIPRENIKVLLDSFVRENGDKASLYELYIDKLTPWEYDIVIYAGEESLTENNCAIVYTTASGVKFNVYTGLEHYFGNIHDLKIEDTPRLSGPPDGSYWVVVDSSGIFKIEKNLWAFPFYSMPNRIDFIPPEIE